MSLRLVKVLKVNGNDIYAEMHNEYLMSDYTRWYDFLKEEYGLRIETLNDIKKNDEIISKRTLDKLKKKIDIKQYIIK